MIPRIRERALVTIRFTPAHRQQYPHYCAMWEGKSGIVLKSEESVSNRGYVTVYVGGRVICIERENIEECMHSISR